MFFVCKAPSSKPSKYRETPIIIRRLGQKTKCGRKLIFSCFSPWCKMSYGMVLKQTKKILQTEIELPVSCMRMCVIWLSPLPQKLLARITPELYL